MKAFSLCRGDFIHGVTTGPNTNCHIVGRLVHKLMQRFQVSVMPALHFYGNHHAIIQVNKINL